MLKTAGIAAIAGALSWCFPGATGPPALAFDRRVEVTNHTRQAIVELYLSDPGEAVWQRDILGDQVLAPNSSLSVDFDDRRMGCRFDVKIVFDDGESRIRRDVDVCAGERYAISYR